MKKNIIIGVSILLIMIVGYFAYLNITSNNGVDYNFTDESGTLVKSNNISEENIGESKFEIEITDNSEIYEIDSESTVSYTAQKKFFSKPTEAITGTTNDISGDFVVDLENKIISVDILINSQTLKTGNVARDKYVRGQINGDISVIVEKVSFNDSKNISINVPVVLTINGISRIINFNTNGSISDENGVLSSSAEINMNNFNIEPASLANVYTVDEMATISFDLILN